VKTQQEKQSSVFLQEYAEKDGLRAKKWEKVCKSKKKLFTLRVLGNEK